MTPVPFDLQPTLEGPLVTLRPLSQPTTIGSSRLLPIL